MKRFLLFGVLLAFVFVLGCAQSEKKLSELDSVALKLEQIQKAQAANQPVAGENEVLNRSENFKKNSSSDLTENKDGLQNGQKLQNGPAANHSNAGRSSSNASISADNPLAELSAAENRAVATGPVASPKACADGTREGECSANMPFYCLSNSLSPNPSKCGCPAGYAGDGESCVEISKCADGTFEGRCSAQLPFFCEKKTLTKRASVCGCNAFEFRVEDSCTLGPKTCIDGTQALSCSSQKPKYCDDGTLIDRPVACGCPFGTALSDGACEELKCLDGTKYGACSVQLPYFCNGGILVKNASFCGCPENSNSNGNDCIEIVCSDGTKNSACSLQKPKYCLSGNLVDKAEICGCPPGFNMIGGVCQESRCADGTAYGACSILKPNYCDNGVLTKNSTFCGCPLNLTVQGSDCTEISCIDGTKNYDCSFQKPNFCNGGVLAARPEICGCPAGLQLIGGACSEIKCADGTLYGKCSSSKPLFCKEGNLVEIPRYCGCPSGNYILNGKCESSSSGSWENIDLNEIASPIYGIYGFVEYLIISEEQDISIQTSTGDIKAAVEIWSDFVSKTDATWWASHLQIKATAHQNNPYLSAHLTPGKYSIMYLHWPSEDSKPIASQISRVSSIKTFREIPVLANPGNIIVSSYTFPDDFRNNLDPDKWEMQLNLAYTKFVDLLGKRPTYNSGTIESIYRPGIPTCDCLCIWGVDKTKIFIGSAYSVCVINGLSDKNPGWGIVHEMGHIFSSEEGSFLWGGSTSEAYASFFAFYLYDTGVFENPAYPRTYFDNHAQNYISSSRNWNDIGVDELIGLFLKLKDTYGWDLFRKFFRKYSAYDVPSSATAEEKERLMVKYLSDSAEEISAGGKADVISKLRDWRFSVD